MFQLDDKFLEEVGLGSLPDDQKKLFLDHFREQLELRVGLQLSEGLSEMQLAEFAEVVGPASSELSRGGDANGQSSQGRSYRQPRYDSSRRRGSIGYGRGWDLGACDCNCRG